MECSPFVDVASFGVVGVVLVVVGVVVGSVVEDQASASTLVALTRSQK